MSPAWLQDSGNEPIQPRFSPVGVKHDQRSEEPGQGTAQNVADIVGPNVNPGEGDEDGGGEEIPPRSRSP